MLDLVEFGRRLQSERKRLGLNQEALGGQTGVSRAAQATYEAGRTPPDILYMERLSEAGIDGNYVLSGRGSSEVAGDLFDWDLAGEILAGIQDFASEAGLRISPQKQMALLKLLYRQSARDRRMDHAALRELMGLAA